jgi:hypothetical protein
MKTACVIATKWVWWLADEAQEGDLGSAPVTPVLQAQLHYLEVAEPKLL